MVKFQRLFKELSDDVAKQLDVLSCCLTIASACINYYLINCLEENDKRIAIIPENGIIIVFSDVEEKHYKAAIN